MAYLVSGLILALLVSIFALTNQKPVDVRFFFWTAQIPLVLVILGSAVAGAFLVFVLGLVKQWRLGGRIREYQARVRVLEAELEARGNRTDGSTAGATPAQDPSGNATNPGEDKHS